NPYICDEVTRLDELTNPSGFFLGTLVDKPCWNIHQQAITRNFVYSFHERALARNERRMAARMASQVAEACRPISANERERSLFEPERIVQIVPIVEASVFRGVRVVLRPGIGLTATYVGQQLACRHALWVASGQDPNFAPSDPTMMPGQSVQVEDRGDHVE